MLTTNNSDIIALNKQVLKKLEGDPIDYYNANTWHDLDIAMPEEFVNFLTLNGLPSHKLTLKKEAIVYVVRNLNENTYTKNIVLTEVLR